MFNYIGDGNGRHNLPGSPMLETFTAALAALGFVLAVTRLRRPEFALPFIWWLVMSQGGVWSLAFEAPQGYRTIDEVVAVALLAALPIAVLAERLIAIGGRARINLPRPPGPRSARPRPGWSSPSPLGAVALRERRALLRPAGEQLRRLGRPRVARAADRPRADAAARSVRSTSTRPPRGPDGQVHLA